jgi:hypothetical protein
VAALALSALAGCSDGPTSVLVDVSAQGGLSVQELAATIQLETHQSANPILPTSGGALTLPGHFVIVLPADVAMRVDVALVGQDAAGGTVSAAGFVESEPHRQVELALELDELPDGGSLPDLAAPPGDLAGRDGGIVFQPQASGVTKALDGVGGSGPGHVYAVGEAGTILHSTGNGVWSAQNSTVSSSLLAVWAVSASDIYVVGASGVILHSTGGGAWTKQTSGVTGELHGVWAAASNDVWAVGEGGTILHSDAAGVWNKRTSGVTDTLYAVRGGDVGEEVFAGVAPSGILHSTNGTTFSALDSTDTLFGLWSGFAVGAGGVAVRRSGASWVPLASVTANDLRGVWGSAPIDLYAVGLAGTLLHGDTNALQPAPSGTQVPLFAVWGSGPSDVYAVGGSGTILHGP